MYVAYHARSRLQDGGAEIDLSAGRALELWSWRTACHTTRLSSPPPRRASPASRDPLTHTPLPVSLFSLYFSSRVSDLEALLPLLRDTGPRMVERGGREQRICTNPPPPRLPRGRQAGTCPGNLRAAAASCGWDDVRLDVLVGDRLTISQPMQREAQSVIHHANLHRT